MQTEFPFLTSRKVFSVSELTSALSELMEAHFGAIFIEGEITNLREPSSGHLYFTLKDSQAQLRGVVFRRQRILFDFAPEEGMQVTCRGRLTIYQPRGDLQLIIDWMEPSGRGANRIALEKLKRKLASEGLFDEERKKPLPALPQTIGIVTSPTGAAIRDILNIITKKKTKVSILLYPARVQGEQAPHEIAEGIAFFNRHKLVDVLIVGRGGGSFEDLNAFNTEEVVRAIAASEIPVISAVGHEIDVTLSDLAADRRAPTPTAAAEIVILEREQWNTRLLDLERRLINTFRLILQDRRILLKQLEKRLTDPRHRLSLLRLRLDDSTTRLSSAMHRFLENKRHLVQRAYHHLYPFNPARTLPSLREQLSLCRENLTREMENLLRTHRHQLSRHIALLHSYNPKNVLKRGYSITLREGSGEIVKESSTVSKGEIVHVHLAKGKLGCEVQQVG